MIWAVDNSGTMADDFMDLSNGLTDFVERASVGGYDLHVVLLSGYELYSQVRADSTRYTLRHVNVGSVDALEVILTDYENYAAFLRPDSAVHVVVSTDDNSNTEADAFEQQMQAILGRPFQFHAVREIPDFGLGTAPDAYGDLASSTGGLDLRIASEWSPLLEGTMRGSATYCAPLDSP